MYNQSKISLGTIGAGEPKKISTFRLLSALSIALVIGVGALSSNQTTHAQEEIIQSDYIYIYLDDLKDPSLGFSILDQDLIPEGMNARNGSFTFNASSFINSITTNNSTTISNELHVSFTHTIIGSPQTNVSGRFSIIPQWLTPGGQWVDTGPARTFTARYANTNSSTTWTRAQLGNRVGGSYRLRLVAIDSLPFTTAAYRVSGTVIGR